MIKEEQTKQKQYKNKKQNRIFKLESSNNYNLSAYYHISNQGKGCFKRITYCKITNINIFVSPGWNEMEK